MDPYSRDMTHRPGSAGSNMSAWDSPYGKHEDIELDEPVAMEGDTYGSGSKSNSNGTSIDGKSIDQEDEPDGCWWRFKKLIRSCWATRYTEDTKQNRELYIKTTVRELVTYIIFLIILIIISFGMINSVRYYYTKVIRTLFLKQQFLDSSTTFESATTISDFWKFLYGPLLNGLFWDKWYNGKAITKPEDMLIYYENKLLGVPRIRQLRIKDDSCEIPKDFKAEIKHCYAEFSTKFEEKEPFGLKTPTAWVHTPSDKMNSSGFMSVIGDYHDGGYYLDLSNDKNETLDMFKKLFDNNWIDLQTRVVFIDFTLYNANINLFSVIRLMFYFPATGGVTTESDIRVVKLMRYVTGFDYFIGVCELVFLAFIGYYVIEEALEIKKHGCSYFTEFWNWLDILVIIISGICAGFNIYRTAVVGRMLEMLISNTSQFPSFDFLSYCQQHFNNAIAVTLFIAWVKIFKYISFNKTMTQLSSTLGRCSKDLAGFAVMFFIVFFAFAQLGFFIFGSQLKDFKTLYDAGITQFRIVLGDFDYQQLESVHRVLGPIYFILFVFFVFFVLINMFLAIINDTYGEVKAELATQKNEFEMTDYFKKRAKTMLDKITMKQQKIKDIQQAIKSADINHDMEVDFDEWRNELKSRGYAEGEIEAVFAKYDADGDRVLNSAEQRKMQDDLKIEREDLEQRINKTDPDGDGIPGNSHRSGNATAANVSIDEFTDLKIRVSNMEDKIGNIINKLDNLLTDFSLMGQMKTDRSECIYNILETLVGSQDLSEVDRRNKFNNLIDRELEKYEVNDNAQYRSFDSQSRPTTAISSRSLLSKR